MNARRIAGLAAGAVALGALAACAVNPVTGQRSFTAFMSAEDEKRIGREEHPRILALFGGAYDDKAIEAYVTVMGQSLARVSERPELDYVFAVLNSPTVNAFALPDGRVYVTRGLVALAGSESELASVLAHEIGHVVARHAAERYSRAVLAGVSTTLAAIIAGGDADQSPEAYSREQETQADVLAVRYLAKAGYDTGAVASFLARLDAEAKLDGQGGGFAATHPRTAERVQAALALGAAAPAPRRVESRAEFLKRLDGLLYGDDPHEGLARGRVFMHPVLGFRFEVPPGFRLSNAPERVLARDGRDALIVFDTARQGRGQTPQAYMTEIWARDMVLTDVEVIAVDGLAGATGWTRVDTNRGPRDLRLVAIRAEDGAIYRFTFVTPPVLTRALADDFRRTTYSFRALTPAERERARPWRLRIVEIGAGDTAEALAKRLPEGEGRLERFRVLNGLGSGEEPKKGSFVKLFWD